MTRGVAGLLAIVLAMAAFVAVQASKVPHRDAAPTVVAETTVTAASTPRTAAGANVPVVTESSLPAPKRDLAEIQRRISSGEMGTYLREILLQRDDNVARWPDHELEPLRVWIQPVSTLSDFGASYPVRAREAFERWMRVGIPIRFVFVVDSARADIPVVWVDHFDMPITGRTRWSRDQHWWITGASIDIALHHQSGGALDAPSIYAIALHEVGHLIGLDHTQDDRNIMAARVRVSELSPADEATAQLIYSVPPGSVSKP